MTLVRVKVGPLWSWLKRNRAELKLCLRVSASGVLTLLLSQLLQLRFALWAVLTAVLLTQLNVGRSLKATTDYLAGTLGGAVFAGAVGALVAHQNEASLVAALAVALVAVGFIAAKNSRFGAAPFTVVLVLLAPTVTHLGPIASARERVIEVAVGCLVGLAVSLFVLPAQAYDMAIEKAARLLDLMARDLPQFLSRLAEGCEARPDPRDSHELDQVYAELLAIAMEGGHERMTYLASVPDLGRLLRTLHRLRDDFAMIARTAIAPLPTMVEECLRTPLLEVGETGADYLRASGVALAGHRKAPSRGTVDVALHRCAAGIATLRTHDYHLLPIDVVERVFTLGFALDQLCQHFADLERCIAGHAERPR